MAKRLKAMSVAEAVNCCHQSDDSDLDSSAWGLSSDEEENLLTYYWKIIGLKQVGLVIHFKIFGFYLFYDKNLVLPYYWHRCCKWFYLLLVTL